MYTHEWLNRRWPLILTVTSQLKDFLRSRESRGLHYKSGSVSISETVQERHVVTTDRPPYQVTLWPTKQRHIRWPWVTFKVIHPLQAFLNATFRTAVQQLTRFRPTQRIARSLCDTWTSCVVTPIVCLLGVYIFNHWRRQGPGVSPGPQS